MSRHIRAWSSPTPVPEATGEVIAWPPAIPAITLHDRFYAAGWLYALSRPAPVYLRPCDAALAGLSFAEAADATLAFIDGALEARLHTDKARH